MIPPKTQYVEHQGSLIAYQVFGHGATDLMLCGGLSSNIDHLWDFPAVVHRLERLASFARVIMFDRRGTGHSDPLPTDRLPSWEDWADDMGAVLDAAVSTQAAVFGERDGGLMALVFAATHPERVSSLILGNCIARYLVAPDYPCGRPPAMAERVVSLFREKWGTEEFAASVWPSYAADPVALRLVARQMRGAATPRVAAVHFRYFFDLDMRSVLGTIHVPTLVLNKQRWPLVPVEMGRFLAEHIPGARMVELPGADANLLASKDAGEPVDHIQEFLTGMNTELEPDRVLATVFFCDIVDSTKLAAALGDRAWRELKERFFGLVRQELPRFGGREIDTAGDGIFMTFDRPTRAVRCASALKDSVRELGLEVRCGLHTGECTINGQQVSGIAVHTGARIAATAAPGEVWVSPTVKDLVAGSGINFEERGTHMLKGVPGQWALFAVS